MELRDFLIKAKKATYANASVEKVAASRRGSNDYEYSDNGNAKNRAKIPFFFIKAFLLVFHKYGQSWFLICDYRYK